jgi:hypothetical protein
MADITMLPIKPQQQKLRKPRQRRPRPINVDAVMAMVELRDEMRARGAARRQFEKQNAAWRRITAKLVTLVIVGGCTFIVIAHAMR